MFGNFQPSKSKRFIRRPVAFPRPPLLLELPVELLTPQPFRLELLACSVKRELKILVHVVAVEVPEHWRVDVFRRRMAGFAVIVNDHLTRGHRDVQAPSLRLDDRDGVRPR